MTDRLKLSDPTGDAEVDKIAVAAEQEDRIQQLRKNIAALQSKLAKQTANAAPSPAPAANNKIGARKHGSFKAISTAPSINWTPHGPTMVPVPYPVVQDLSSSVNTARTVRFNGCPVYLLDASTQPKCTGDERGTGKGIKSGTVSGEVKPVQGSSTVRVEGKQVVREGDACMMNGGNCPGIYVTTPATSGAAPKEAARNSNPSTRKLSSGQPSGVTELARILKSMQPAGQLNDLLRLVQNDTLSGNFPHTYPTSTPVERRQVAEMNSRVRGPSLIPWDGDDRPPAQRVADETTAIFNSSIGGALYGVARVIGAGDSFARIAGGIGNGIDISAGVSTTNSIPTFGSSRSISSSNGIKILSRKTLSWNVSRETLEANARKKAEIYQQWKQDVGGQYHSLEEQAESFKELISNQSPWPAGYTPKNEVLPVGTKMYMAMSPGQPPTSPGGFGTLDKISDVNAVRDRLAVKSAWKKEISHVVEYEIFKPLPVRSGPVGPQIDHRAGIYLPGKGSQVNFDIPSGNSRMDYLKVVQVNQIK